MSIFKHTDVIHTILEYLTNYSTKINNKIEGNIILAIAIVKIYRYYVIYIFVFLINNNSTINILSWLFMKILYLLLSFCSLVETCEFDEIPCLLVLTLIAICRESVIQAFFLESFM